MILTLDAANDTVDDARAMCIKATHERPVPIAPCIPHVIAAARAAFAP